MKNIIILSLLLAVISACTKETTTTTKQSSSGLGGYTTGGYSTGGTSGGSTTGSSTGFTTGGTTGGSTTGSTTGGSTTGTNTNGGVTGGSTGSSCAGNSSDGTGAGQSLRQFTLLMSGDGTSSGSRIWMPGISAASNVVGYGSPTYFPSITDARLLLASDTRYKVRLKVLPQLQNTACHMRETGAGDSFVYKKLKFQVALRDVNCSNNVSCTGCSLGAPYAQQTVGPINQNECSSVIDFSSSRNYSACGTVVQVGYVQADSECQTNGWYCPSEKNVRKQSCWNMTLQVSTDSTQDFK
jgi:hypothetical protein